MKGSCYIMRGHYSLNANALLIRLPIMWRVNRLHLNSIQVHLSWVFKSQLDTVETFFWGQQENKPFLDLF